MPEFLPSLPPTVTAKEFAKAVGVSSETALRWASEGRVEHMRVGGRVRFPASAVNEIVRVIPARTEES